jgi:hypothetical protein
MLRYETEQPAQKWTRTELKWVAGGVAMLLCIWGIVSWRNYAGDETQHLLTRTTAQLAEARDKIASLTASLADAQKQLAEANSKVIALTSVAARAPQLPVHVKQWRDSSVTHSIALQNQGDKDLSVHLTVSNPGFSRSREQDCSVPAHRTINTPIKIYPHDVAILTADGFATRSEKLDQQGQASEEAAP